MSVEATWSPLLLATLTDEAGALEHLQVLGDRRQRHLAQERLGEIRDTRLTVRQAREDRAPGGIGEGGEHLAQGVAHSQ